jgi:UDP-glucose 4-epimerase
LKSLKVLVTGGAGFIGSNIVDLLIENDMSVVVVDNLSSGKLENVNDRAKFYKCDIRERRIFEVIEIENPEVVIHNAAQISVRNSVEDPENDASINILGSINLFEACRKHNVKKIIFASSGGTVYGEQVAFPADEEHQTKPICPYGVAKLSVEKYLYYYYVIFGIKYIALRYANVYGPRQDPHGEAGVVAIFSEKILAGDQPIINGDGKQTRDYVYVGDAALANLLAINSNFVGELNIGTGIETNVIEIFNILRDISGREDLSELHGPAKEGEQRRSVLSYKKAKEILGWQPQVKINEGLLMTFNWFRGNINI